MKYRLLVPMALLVVALSQTSASAIPSPLDHAHSGTTVHWKQPGSPALPWNNTTANMWNHNHLTTNPFNNPQDFVINKAWDNRTLRNSLGGGPANFGHGMILNDNDVRYGWGAGVPGDAKNAVEAVFNDWVAKSTIQFNASKNSWDVLAMRFERQNAGAKELTIEWVEDLGPVGDKAYGVFDGVGTISFEATPTFQLKTTGGLKQIRLGDAGASGTQITVAVDWSFDGTPMKTSTDIDYSVDGGTTWTDTAPGGFGNLDWAGAGFGNALTPTDKIDFWEMDFRTIARHEVGHSIALGHTGADLSAIMRTDIANFALFGKTMQIDSDSALGAAIDYTYATPEPGTLTLLGIGIFGLCSQRWRRRRLSLT